MLVQIRRLRKMRQRISLTGLRWQQDRLSVSSLTALGRKESSYFLTVYWGVKRENAFRQVKL